MVLSVQKRWEIVFLSKHRRGPQLGITDVAKEVGVSYDTVKKWLTRYEETGDIEDKSHPGRPKKTSSKIDKQIILAAQQDRTVSAEDIKNKLKRRGVDLSTSTIRRRLNDSGFHSGPPTSKPFLKVQHVEKRLQWAVSNRDRDWNRVVFTDETTIQLFQSPNRVWKRKGEMVVASTVKHPPKVHVWGCFSSKGFGRLVIFTGILDSFKLCRIYEKGLLPSAQMWFGNDWTLLEDNDPKHTSRYSKQWKMEHSVERMDWPAQSPDQNPIENVWHLLKYKVAKLQPRTIKELKRAIILVWSKFDRSLAQKYVESMSKRIEALLESQGDITIY